MHGGVLGGGGRARPGRANHDGPVVIAPLRLWREGVANFERAFECFDRLRPPSGTSIPAITHEIETTHHRLADAVRAAYGPPEAAVPRAHPRVSRPT